MQRRMSCALTVAAVRDRSKTVTRRRADTWTRLQRGDRLTLVEKAMGLPKGAHQVVLAEVEVVRVSVEPLASMTESDLAREGLGAMTMREFVDMWCETHGYSAVVGLKRLLILCRRIEWRYLNEGNQP